MVEFHLTCQFTRVYMMILMSVYPSVQVPANVPVWTKFLNPKLYDGYNDLQDISPNSTEKKTSHPATNKTKTCLRYLFSPLKTKTVTTNKQDPCVFPQRKNLTTKNIHGENFSPVEKNSLSVKLVVVTVACRRVVSWSANLGVDIVKDAQNWTDIFGAH